MVPVDICMRVMCIVRMHDTMHIHVRMGWYACTSSGAVFNGPIHGMCSSLSSSTCHAWCMHARQHTCTRTQTSITSAIYGADKHHFSMVTEHGRLVMFRTCWTSRMCTPLLALGKAIEQDTKGCLGSLAFPSPGCLSCLDYTRLSASHSESLAVCACDAPL